MNSNEQACDMLLERLNKPITITVDGRPYQTNMFGQIVYDIYCKKYRSIIDLEYYEVEDILNEFTWHINNDFVEWLENLPECKVRYNSLEEHVAVLYTNVFIPFMYGSKRLHIYGKVRDYFREYIRKHKLAQKHLIQNGLTLVTLEQKIDENGELYIEEIPCYDIDNSIHFKEDCELFQIIDSVFGHDKVKKQVKQMCDYLAQGYKRNDISVIMGVSPQVVSYWITKLTKSAKFDDFRKGWGFYLEDELENIEKVHNECKK